MLHYKVELQKTQFLQNRLYSINVKSGKKIFNVKKEIVNLSI